MLVCLYHVNSNQQVLSWSMITFKNLLIMSKILFDMILID